MSSRVGVTEDVWVLWQCNGKEDISRIGDLSTGGLFLQTPIAKPVGHSVRLHFLVQEGEIKAEGVIRHIERGSGLGVKFLALNDQGRPRLAALLTRLRSQAQVQGS